MLFPQFFSPVLNSSVHIIAALFVFFGYIAAQLNLGIAISGPGSLAILRSVPMVPKVIPQSKIILEVVSIIRWCFIQT
jgi:hypothetical protein